MVFNVFFPGDPLILLAYLGPGVHLGPFSLPEGIFITTPQQVLFKSLRSVGVPKIYVLTLEMAYRYVFLIMDMIREMYNAKKDEHMHIHGKTVHEYLPAHEKEKEHHPQHLT